MTATFDTTFSDSLTCALTPYWSEMLTAYEEGALLPFSKVQSFHQYLLSFKIDSIAALHLFLRNFSAALLIHQDSSCLQELFFSLQKQEVLFKETLYSSYFLSIATLLAKAQLPTSYQLLVSLNPKSFATPVLNAEHGILCFLQGVLLQDRSYIQQGLEIAFLQQEYLDAYGNIFKGAVCQESQCSDEEIYWIYSLLFSLGSFFLPDQKIMTQAYKSLSGFLEENIETTTEKTFFFSLLHIFFRKKLSQLPQLTEQAYEISTCFVEGSGLTVKHLSKTSSVLCSAGGKGLGFCFMKKNQVEFVSIGQSQGNIGEMVAFGSWFDYDKIPQKPLVRIESSEKGFYFNTWLKCVDPAQEQFSKNWFHVCCILESERLDICVKPTNFLEEDLLHLLFFVKADKVIVDQTFHLSPHTLDRYEGKVATLSFFKDNHPVFLESSLGTTMKVIPLSGQQHFWGAEFLVAYTLPQDESVSFQIH